MKKEDLIRKAKDWYENGECYTRFDSDKVKIIYKK